MKILVGVSIVVLFSLCFWNCSGEQNPIANETISQYVTVTAYSRYVSHDSVKLDVDCSGTVYAEKVPVLEFFRLGNRVFNGGNYTNYLPGRVWFNNYNNRVSSNLNPLELEVMTSLGSLKGVMTPPDTMKNVVFSATNLHIGQSLTISWEDSHADFYEVNATYQYNVGGRNTFLVRLDTCVIGTSVTFDGDIFVNPGSFRLDLLQPAKGPLPLPGAKPNMSGQGIGYFRYVAIEYDPVRMTIPVGGDAKNF